MPFKENIETAANRISDYIKDKEEVSSWQVKVSLHLSGSMMYMALGMLEAWGKINVEPDGINYKITKTPAQQ
jgi:hypothetical protein